MQAATKHRTSSLLAQCQYPIRWHKGKGTWTAWPVGLPVTAMDTTKEKTRRRLYRAIQSHLECLIERGRPLPSPSRKPLGKNEVYAVSLWRPCTGDIIEHRGYGQ